MSAYHDPPHASNLRKGRQSVSGWPYYITKLIQRRKRGDLIKRECAQFVIDTFKWANQQSWWVNLGFVIMPDHYHLIIGLGNVKTLSDAIKSVSMFTARKINALIGQRGDFWHEGFYDHVVRDRRDFDRILAYVHNNPVKAGLVDRPEQWPYSTAHAQLASEINWDWINGVVKYPGEDYPSFDEIVGSGE